MDGRGREEINEEIYSPNPHYFRVNGCNFNYLKLI